MQRNPRFGKHPDLFSTEDTRIHVPLAQLSREEIEGMSAADFDVSELTELRDTDTDLFDTVMLSTLDHVVKCIKDAVSKDVEERKSQDGIESLFRDQIKSNDLIPDIIRDAKAEGNVPDEYDEPFLTFWLQNTKNWTLGWYEDKRKYADWSYLASDLEPTFDLEFSDPSFSMITMDQWDSINMDVDAMDVDISGCEVQPIKNRLAVRVTYDMPGWYCGNVNWKKLEEENELNALKSEFGDNIVIGYWTQGGEEIPRDPNWKPRHESTYRAVIDWLSGPYDSEQGYKGVSRCRICNAPNGSFEYTKSGLVFPQGYIHYIRDHDVVPDRMVIERTVAVAARKPKTDDTDGFIDMYPALQRGKVLKTLNSERSFDRKIMSIKDKVRLLVNEGYKIVGDRLATWEGFYTAKELTQTGMDYAAYMIAKRAPVHQPVQSLSARYLKCSLNIY